MKIGIDIDDTICSTWEVVIEQICNYYNLDINDYKSNREGYAGIIKKLGEEEYIRIIREYVKPYILSVPLKKNAKKVINELSKNNEIIFITSRTSAEFGDPYAICREYLDKFGICYDKIIVNASDKGLICKNEGIVLFIDDREHNCKSVSDQGIDVLLFTALYNKECNDYKRVNSWIEVKEYIDNLNK